MGFKTKAGFYCDHCEHPVVAQKGTSRIRNTAMVLGAPVTGGASLAATSYNDWACPGCGSPVRRLRQEDLAPAETPSQASDKPKGIEARIAEAQAIGRYNAERDKG